MASVASFAFSLLPAQDKLLEEMWKQQDSLDGAPAAEAPPSPQAAADNPLLERLRVLEVSRV